MRTVTPRSDPFEGFTDTERPEPRYLALWRSGELAERVAQAIADLERCQACPRGCQVDRLHAVPTAPSQRPEPGQRKRSVATHIAPGTACFTGRYARVATAYPHFGEEACLKGTQGSGTIFFSFCNLRCVFCQNWDISQVGGGEEMSAERLAGRMLDLQRQGCHNINWVTPEHVVPQALEALLIAIEGGLRLPIVYNTSGYDAMESLALLDGVIDVYMPDFKVWTESTAKEQLKAADYAQVATETIAEMHRQVGPLHIGPDGLATRGLLVRHLVMPGQLDEARAIFRYLAERVSTDTYVNVMAQYYPAGSVPSPRHPSLGERVPPVDVNDATEAALTAGLWRLDRAH
jgi:putative pyruvate formate lyase activating enzyme